MDTQRIAFDLMVPKDKKDPNYKFFAINHLCIFSYLEQFGLTHKEIKSIKEFKAPNESIVPEGIECVVTDENDKQLRVYLEYDLNFNNLWVKEYILIDKLSSDKNMKKAMDELYSVVLPVYYSVDLYKEFKGLDTK